MLEGWGRQGRMLARVEDEMAQARTYAQWQQAASRHDRLSGREDWKRRDDTTLYDFADIRIRHDYLRSLLDDHNHDELLYALNEGIHGNMSGIGQPILYNQSKLGTKQLVDEYVNVIVESLRFISRVDDSKIPLAAKLDFFRRASHCYGRSALMLSGGAGLIYFHHGVVQTLIDNDLLPNVISGASAGSWVSAQLAMYTNEELRAGHFDRFRYDMPTHLNPLKVLAGLEPDVSPLTVRESALDSINNTMTFQEAYEHTGRYINVSIAPSEKHQNSRLMNAITSPNVYIRSAIEASSSIPGVLPAVQLFAKGADGKPKPYLPSRRWVDGSFAQDLPAKRLSRLFGVNHYLVSMINPLAVPFVEDPKIRYKKGVTNIANGLVLNAAKDVLKSAEDYLSRFGASFVSPAILLAHAVLDQEYTGDVNLILEKKDFHWRNVLFSFKDDREVQQMILAGKRSTWEKLAMIRNATVIGRELDAILESLDVRELGAFGGAMGRRHLVA